MLFSKAASTVSTLLTYACVQVQAGMTIDGKYYSSALIDDPNTSVVKHDNVGMHGKFAYLVNKQNLPVEILYFQAISSKESCYWLYMLLEDPYRGFLLHIRSEAKPVPGSTREYSFKCKLVKPQNAVHLFNQVKVFKALGELMSNNEAKYPVDGDRRWHAKCPEGYHTKQVDEQVVCEYDQVGRYSEGKAMSAPLLHSLGSGLLTVYLDPFDYNDSDL